MHEPCIGEAVAHIGWNAVLIGDEQRADQRRIPSEQRVDSFAGIAAPTTEPFRCAGLNDGDLRTQPAIGCAECAARTHHATGRGSAIGDADGDRHAAFVISGRAGLPIASPAGRHAFVDGHEQCRLACERRATRDGSLRVGASDEVSGDEDGGQRDRNERSAPAKDDRRKRSKDQRSHRGHERQSRTRWNER